MAKIIRWDEVQRQKRKMDHNKIEEPELTKERISKLWKEILGHYPSPDMFGEDEDGQ